jgi:O-antigen ligase
VFFGIAAVLVVGVLLTSSRGGMLALVAVLALMALDNGRLPEVETADKRRRSRAPAILGALVGGALIATAVWSQLPAETRQRLSSVFSLESDYNMSAQTGRVQIWKRGMRALGERPVGYGVDTYGMVDLRFGGKMFTAHNALVQISVELGVLGVILYVVILFRVWFGLSKVRKIMAQSQLRDTEQIEQATFCRMLQLSLIGNVIAGMFLSSAYFMVHWTTLALALGCIARFYRRIDEGGAEDVSTEPPRRRAFIEVGRVVR